MNQIIPTRAIIGTKLGMTQIFNSSGILIPVTVVKVLKNVIAGVKTQEKDGYVATLIAYGEAKEKKFNKPELGFFKKNNLKPAEHMKEIRNMSGFELGSNLPLDLFKIGEIVDVEAVSKGHGFTGAIERWNMRIGPMSHGAGYPHRFQGSLGGNRGGSSAQHVFKGKRMSGRWGSDNTTIENLQIIDIDFEKELVLIKGSLPGPKMSYVTIVQSEKQPNAIHKIQLVDLKTEAEKNKYITEAKHYSVNLSSEMSVNEMKKLIEEAKAKKAAETAAPSEAEGENK